MVIHWYSDYLQNFQLHHSQQLSGGGSRSSNSSWSQKINEYMCLKLSLVNEIVAEIPLLQMQLPNETDVCYAAAGEGGGAAGGGGGYGTSPPSTENFICQQSSIMACLALIGGFDPR